MSTAAPFDPAPPSQQDLPLRCLGQAGGSPLWLLARPGPPIVAARFWLGSGSGNDPSGQRGAHQLLAGSLLRGCGDLSGEQMADLVEGCGAALRCEAYEDNLLLSLKCASEDAGQLLPLLVRMVARPRLEESQVALERQLNLQTLQRQREDPFQLAHDRLRLQLYGQGAYGHDPLGVDEELAALNPSHLQTLLPGLAAGGSVLVVSGQCDLPLAELLAAEAASAGWSSTAPISDPNAAGEPGVRPPAERFAALEEDTEQLVILLGTSAAAMAEPDARALRLLMGHLGIGMSSRLFVRLREDLGLAYDVGVNFPARRQAAPFLLHMSTGADRAGEATAALLAEWLRLLEEPLTRSELDLAKIKLRGQDAMGRQTCGQMADRLALVLGHGLPADYVERALESQARLEASELLAAARRRLMAPSLCLCGPAQALQAAERVWRQHPLAALTAPAAP